MKPFNQMGQSEQARYNTRASELRRMRIIAIALLLVMAFIFACGTYLEKNIHANWGYLRAFAEAGMVGGLADWFAVTALFRHPMGIPIPHTAIIPTNKQRIGSSLASFLQSNFLTARVVARRVHKMDVAGALGRFLMQPTGGEGRMRRGASRLFGDVVTSLDDERLGGLAKEALRKQLSGLKVAPLLGQMLETMLAQNRHVAILDSIIKWAAKTLNSNENMIHEMVEQRANKIMRWTGLDEKLANSIIEGLNKLLVDMAADPEHELRQKGEEGLHKLAHDLQSKKSLQNKVENWKDELLDNPAIANWLDGIWQQARASLLKASRDPDAAMAGKFGEMLTQLGSSLQEDVRLRGQINRFARRAIVGTTENYGDKIVALVSDTIERWDTATLTDRVENIVGKDLQFIRINGTLVGGLVGIVIHGISRLIG